MTKLHVNEGLTGRQLRAIPFLVASPTIEAGCKKANISRKIYYDWMANSEFRAELKRARDVAIEEALVSLKGAMNKAAEALINLLESTKTETLKRAVALDIINAGLKAVELSDMEERLEKIERRLQC